MTVGPRSLQVLGPSTGGIRVHVATLAEGLQRRGLEARVVGPAGVLEGLWPQDGDVPVPAGMSPLGLLRARRSLAPWRGRADVVHAHGLKAAWAAVRGRPARPLVVTVHNVVLDASAGRAAGVQRRLEAAVLRRADAVVAPTPAMAEDLCRFLPRERVRAVVPASPPPRVEEPRARVRARLGVGDDTPLVVCVSRLHPQKDLATLLRAWSAVSGRRPDAVLAVVGEGPQRAELVGEARRLGVAGSVRWCGFRPHAVDEIAAADAFVLTSLWEAVPLVLAEALQLGVPVVSTDVGMAAELVAGARCGTVVPVGDAEGVAAGLDAVLDDPATARRDAAEGAAAARHRFDPDRLVGEVADLYRELA